METSTPVPSAPTRNAASTTDTATQLPRIGRSNSTIDARITAMPVSCDSTRYGTVLPTTNASVEIGAMRICSMVPFSFSRTIDNAVETTAVIIEMYEISPGTRYSVLRSSGLYQTRDSTPTSTGRTVPPAAADASRRTAVV